LQTLSFTDEFNLKNQQLIHLLASKPVDLEEQLITVLTDKSLLVALFLIDGTKEMQQAMITLKDGKTFLLAFSNTQSFNSWSNEARPLPLTSTEIAKSVLSLNIDGFIIDINEEYRYKVESILCDAIYNDKSAPTYLNEDFRDAVKNIIKNYPEIDSIDFQDSKVCDARIVFYSRKDIADLVIEISEKFQKSEQIKLLAPQGLDLFVGKN